MEIPSKLKDLYRHWPNHLVKESAQEFYDFQNQTLLQDITWFIRERISIWKQKVVGDAPPYTKDSILSTYRFCNIFREFDRQTIEFHTLLSPLRDNFPLWLMNMFYCRLVARTETVESVGLLSFDKKENEKMYERLMNSPRPRFGTPYVFPVSVILKSDTPTREMFIVKYLPEIMNEVANEISSWQKQSVCEGVQKVIEIFGYNLNFLWTEVLIDVAYQFPEYIDLFKSFPVGPGSLPTMQKIDRDQEPSLLVELLATMPLDVGLTYEGKPLRLSAENWEGIGCEYRKYTNLKEGKGRKRLFGR